MRHGESEYLGTLEIDDQLEPCWSLDGHIGYLAAFEDTVDVVRCALVYVRQIWAVGHQPASPRKSSEETDCRQPSFRDPLGKRCSRMSGEERTTTPSIRSRAAR